MQWMSCIVCLFGIVLMSSGVAIPKERIVERKLSDELHYRGAEHNLDYDHEAFLGEEEAKEFQDLSPEESRERLGKLFDKIDENSDGVIDKAELQKWIKHTQHRFESLQYPYSAQLGGLSLYLVSKKRKISNSRYIDEDVNRQWKSHSTDGSELIPWEQYKKMVRNNFQSVNESQHWFLFNQGMSEDELKGSDGETYAEMMRKDKRRWDKADKDGDGSLSKEEFGVFLHPEESPDLQDIVVAETMEDIDKNKDGKITLEEYIGDLFHGEPGETEPDWVTQEREQFKEFRDKNGDGYLDEDVCSLILIGIIYFSPGKCVVLHSNCAKILRGNAVDELYRLSVRHCVNVQRGGDTEGTNRRESALFHLMSPYLQKLSDELHYRGAEHNLDYDHEAFLGEEEAKEFQDLSPEESRARLGKLFDKIDENSDGVIDKAELQKWIKHTQHRYIDEDVNRQWKSHSTDGSELIPWEQYKKMVRNNFQSINESRQWFRFNQGMSEDELKGSDGETYAEMMRKDKRRWDKADKDGDGSLSKEEFGVFLHPEESPDLQDIVVAETMEDIDKNKDGKAEATHLIYEADTDSDGKLTRTEVLDNFDLFVGSQATDFGEYLSRHDEF
ncbi:unnamed protein product [Notodromas monacha]|uniref:Reticulocalbin-3 n=1 Tax=Notodromas monacha TaxID=399045 RepID=A0A7R9BVE4_9CRUS|nr:unnamed protein product [Notodromas monacha]CAG0920841.1 unnamed protein product [Notodromas monacha]